MTINLLESVLYCDVHPYRRAEWLDTMCQECWEDHCSEESCLEETILHDDDGEPMGTTKDLMTSLES